MFFDSFITMLIQRLITIAILLHGVTACLSAAEKTNVLLLVADDLRCDLSAFGGKEAVTPHLARWLPVRVYSPVLIPGHASEFSQGKSSPGSDATHGSTEASDFTNRRDAGSGCP